METKKTSVKSYIVQYALVFLFTAGASFSQTLSLKANIGVCACWDTFSMNVYELIGLKVGTFSILANSFLVFLQFLMLGRKNFGVRHLLQVPYVVLYGLFINFFYYNLLAPIEINSYAVKVLLVVIAYVGIAVCLGPLTVLNLIMMSVNSCCNVASGKFQIDYAKIRVGLDAGCILLSLISSFLFHLPIRVREGTIMGMLILGPTEKVTMKYCQGFIKWVKEL